jgi:hypothetical protein
VGGQVKPSAAAKSYNVSKVEGASRSSTMITSRLAYISASSDLMR